MIFNEHSDLRGRHAILSASKYHWVNYDEEKLDLTFKRAMAAAKGTQLHDFANDAIQLGIKLPRSNKTLNMYVNDAIGFRMIPEQILVYSVNCFGTADAIRFDEKKKLLRIHDLKTGESPTSMKQLEVYAAMFCLEYVYKPAEIKMDLRIYQSDQVYIHEPDFDEITKIMSKIIAFDRRIDLLKEEVS